MQTTIYLSFSDRKYLRTDSLVCLHGCDVRQVCLGVSERVHGLRMSRGCRESKVVSMLLYNGYMATVVPVARYESDWEVSQVEATLLLLLLAKPLTVCGYVNCEDLRLCLQQEAIWLLISLLCI